jgi:hypothetical protein
MQDEMILVVCNPTEFNQDVRLNVLALRFVLESQQSKFAAIKMTNILEHKPESVYYTLNEFLEHRHRISIKPYSTFLIKVQAVDIHASTVE